MPNINQTLLAGNLVRDIQTQHTKQGLAYVRFTVAVDGPKNRDGQRRTDFSSCVAFGRMAESLGQVGRKGLPIFINGHIRSGSYTDPNGKKHYTMNVAVNSFENLGHRPANPTRQATGPSPDTAQENGSNGYQSSAKNNNQNEESRKNDLEPF